MPALPPMIGPVPDSVLDGYVVNADPEGRSLATTAIRTRSLTARHVLARAVGPAPLEDLLAEARGEARVGTCPLGRNPAHLVQLARVIALQEILTSDRRDALGLLDLALARFGPDRMPPVAQALHAQLAWLSGDPRRAAHLCKLYPRIPEDIRTGLAADLANPFAGGRDPAAWLAAFQSFFPPPGPVLAPGEGCPFDRVTAPAVAPQAGDPLISVIVTSYLPGTELLTSVASLLQQSWDNLEVIVVDDGSPEEYEPVLTKCAELDPRVKVVRLPANGGTYLARNAGLDLAAGDIVTFQDSDDWSHPLRLEHQVRPLLDNASLVATMSDGLLATPQLTLTMPGFRMVSFIASSLMFWREPVMRRIGYFDRVRKAADTEYRRRIVAAFGDHALYRVGGLAYSLIRVQPSSLSRADIRGGGWFHPGREAYRSAYTHWHERIRRGSVSPYLARSPSQRPFAAPAYVGPADVAAGDRTVDVVFVGDWRGVGAVPRAAWHEMRALAGRGLRVAVLHWESFRYPARAGRFLWPPIQELINDGTVTQVLLTDEVTASLLVVREPSVLQFPPFGTSQVRAHRTVVHVSEAPYVGDGGSQQYDPAWCARTVRDLFGAEPLWWCQGTRAREQLATLVGEDVVMEGPEPVLGTSLPWPARTGVRSHLPVIGRHADTRPWSWPAEPDLLLAAYPDSPDIDVRLLGYADVPRRMLGGLLPPNWMVYSDDDLSVRNYLHQLDFFVFFPQVDDIGWDLHSLLEAFAAGCVVILPPRFRRIFGDAAVYCDELSVRRVVREYHTQPGRFLSQSRRAGEWARSRGSGETYANFVLSALGSDTGAVCTARDV